MDSEVSPDPPPEPTTLARGGSAFRYCYLHQSSDHSQESCPAIMCASCGQNGHAAPLCPAGAKSATAEEPAVAAAPAPKPFLSIRKDLFSASAAVSAPSLPPNIFSPNPGQPSVTSPLASTETATVNIADGDGEDGEGVDPLEPRVQNTEKSGSL